jgi:hypothetical protein
LSASDTYTVLLAASTLAANVPQRSGNVEPTQEVVAVPRLPHPEVVEALQVLASNTDIPVRVPT